MNTKIDTVTMINKQAQALAATLSFKDKEEYLNWVSQWKAQWQAMCLRDRQHKLQWKLKPNNRPGKARILQDAINAISFDPTLLTNLPHIEVRRGWYTHRNENMGMIALRKAGKLVASRARQVA